MRPEDRRLTLGLLLSLAIHALLMSLTFSGQGQGFPGFVFPWQDRRAEAPAIRAVLVPAPAPAPVGETLQTGTPALPPSPSLAPAPAASAAMFTVVDPPPAPKDTPTASLREVNPKKVAQPKRVAAAPAVPAFSTLPEPPPIEEVLALPESAKATWAVPPAPEIPTPVVTPTPVPAQVASAPSPQIETPPAPAVENAKQDSQRQAEQAEAARQEAARQLAAQAEAARQAVARQEAAKQEAARQETAKAEAARALAARQEAARLAALRVEAERVEAERQEAAKQAAARQAAPRVEAARIEAARLAALQAEAEKREERLRAIGRQLNEEADRRDAAEAAARRSPSASGLRRGRLFGHTDSHAELILYAEAWSRKIQLNMTFDMVREAAKQAHNRPLVTVAIRSDGSVESVTFVSSSGVPAIDEAIRRIVQSQAPYPAFPPGLQREYDVVEIRRTWQFDMAVRLY